MQIRQFKMTNAYKGSQRLVWVDVGKGVAMFLVILYHCENSLRGDYVVEYYSMTFQSFFLPLFFPCQAICLLPNNFLYKKKQNK